MSEITTPTLGEQPAPTPDVPAAGAQPQPGDTTNAIQSLGMGDLTALLNASETGSLPELPQAPPSAAEAPPAGEEPQVVQIAEEAEPTGSTKSPNRVSLRSLPADEQKLVAEAVALVRAGSATTFAEAVSQLTAGSPDASGEPAAAPVGEATPVDVPPVFQVTPVAPSKVTEIESMIADLRSKREQASTDYDSAEVNRLTAQIEDSLPLLVEARIHAANQQNAIATYKTQYYAAVDALEAQFPDTLDDTSQFSLDLQEKVDAALYRNDPALQKPDYLLTFAKELATKKGIQAGNIQPPPPPKAARPNGAAVVPGHSSVVRPSPDQVKNLIKNASAADIGAVIFTE